MDGYARFKAGNPFGSQAKLLVHLDRLHQYMTTGDTTPVFMEVNPTNIVSRLIRQADTSFETCVRVISLLIIRGFVLSKVDRTYCV